jgi:hypothetical protein
MTKWCPVGQGQRQGRGQQDAPVAGWFEVLSVEIFVGAGSCSVCAIPAVG